MYWSKGLRDVMFLLWILISWYQLVSSILGASQRTKIAASAVEGSSLPVLCFCRKGVCWWPTQRLLEKCDPTHRWDQQLQLPPPPQDAIHWEHAATSFCAGNLLPGGLILQTAFFLTSWESLLHQTSVKDISLFRRLISLGVWLW